METISPDPLFESPHDRARFRRMPGLAEVGLMDASFRDHHFAPHTHDELMLGIMRGGVKRFIREGRAHTVGPGGISVVNPGEVHTGGRVEGDRLVYTAIYAPQRLLEKAGLPPDAGLGPGVIADPACWRLLMAATAQDADPLHAQEALLEGLARLGRHAGRTRRDGRDCPVIAAKAVDYVHARYDAPVGIEELADLAGVTPRHMIRCFRKATGMPPHAYLRQLRVARARDLLKGGLPLAEIAVATGFSDQPQFTRAFRQVTGTTPGRYRRDMTA